MFKSIRKMYWKSRDRGHEVRFILIIEFIIGLLIAGALSAWVLIGRQYLMNQADTVTGSVVTGDAVSGTNSTVSGSSASGATTSGPILSGDASSESATATSSLTPNQTDEPIASALPYDEKGQDTPITSNTVDDIDISSMNQLLSFMNDSDYETLIHQVVALAKIHNSSTAQLLTEYQDIGETDFDVIKYILLDDKTILACNINLDRGGVEATVSDKSLASLKADAKAKKKALRANRKKAKEANKKKSKKRKGKKATRKKARRKPSKKR